ncbi:HNH endonuclease [Bradyrhizobium sp. CCBAU 65884]|uniref:HNH endonuclease n=1 Tax=Bradyrhizobium sp. CCBAU 65884 TaxID=722477 RepID=UPI003FA44A54
MGAVGVNRGDNDTWRHHQDMKTMQLVPRSIDRELAHRSGDSMTTGQDAQAHELSRSHGQPTPTGVRRRHPRAGATYRRAAARAL